MKIFTSYYGQLKNLEKAGILPISISLSTPKWYKGLWYDRLAPAKNMINLAVSTYIPAFKKYILNHRSQEGVLKRLRVMSEGYDEIALICYETPDKFCHRHLVRDWLNIWIVPNYGENNKVVEFVPPVKEKPEAKKKVMQQLSLMF